MTGGVDRRRDKRCCDRRGERSSYRRGERRRYRMGERRKETKRKEKKRKGKNSHCTSSSNEFVDQDVRRELPAFLGKG